MNESTIRRLGAQGALTVKDVVAACGAGSDCAQCVPLIQAVLDEAVPNVPNVPNEGPGLIEQLGSPRA